MRSFVYVSLGICVEYVRYVDEVERKKPMLFFIFMANDSHAHKRCGRVGATSTGRSEL
jgi:hypothetical protein